MGHIGYRRHEHGVRVFLECDETSCSYPIDCIFTASDVRFEGVTDVFALKKFYKLVNALEERAREHSHDREVILRSADDMVEHLRLIKNSREYTHDPPSRR